MGSSGTVAFSIAPVIILQKSSKLNKIGYCQKCTIVIDFDIIIVFYGIKIVGIHQFVVLWPLFAEI